MLPAVMLHILFVQINLPRSIYLLQIVIQDLSMIACTFKYFSGGVFFSYTRHAHQIC